MVPYRSAADRSLLVVEKSMCHWCTSSESHWNGNAYARFCFGPHKPTGENIHPHEIKSAVKGKCPYYAPTIWTRFLRLPIVRWLRKREMVTISIDTIGHSHD